MTKFNRPLIEVLAGWDNKPIVEGLKTLAILKFGETNDYMKKGYRAVPNDQNARMLIMHLHGAIPLYSPCAKLRIIHKVLIMDILFRYCMTGIFDQELYNAVMKCDKDYHYGGSLNQKLLPSPKS